MNNTKTLLITGGCGFVGHHFVEHFHKNKPEWNIIVMDKLTYSGSLDRLRDIKCYPHMNIQVLTCDFAKEIPENIVTELKDVTHIIHMGAESHVDNSITNPEPFVVSNVLGTMHMLNLARKLNKLEAFFYFSTDEVYGPAPLEGNFKYLETSSHNPGNPYAATKSAGDMLCRSFANTYGIPVVTTQCMNIFGERQHKEKFIPLCIKKILKNEVVTIHSSADKIHSGKRTYIHARNVASAYMRMIDSNIQNSSEYDFYKNYHNFNIVGEEEVSNLRLADGIAQVLNKSFRYEMVDFHSSRPGHDLRYAMSGKKLAEWGWTPPETFWNSLKRTVEWYLENPSWLGMEDK